MTVTVIVFFHAVITIENETIFTEAEKYLHIIFRNPNIRQLTSEKILKQHRKATVATYRTTPTLANGQSKEKER